MRVFLALILLAFPVLSFAQGSAPICYVRDEDTVCRFQKMDACWELALKRGGFCRENYRLYGNRGDGRFCVASRYGMDCRYRSRIQCVQRARRIGADSGCVENWLLSPDERIKKEEIDEELEDYGLGCVGEGCED